MAKGKRPKVQKFNVTLTVPEYEQLEKLAASERRPVAGVARIRITNAVQQGAQPNFQLLPRNAQTRKITVALPDLLAKEIRAGLTYPASMAATLRAHMLAGLTPSSGTVAPNILIPVSVRGQVTKAITLNRVNLLIHTQFLIASIRPALDYDPARQHNQEPPELWRNDDDYLLELRRLAKELRTLNKILSVPALIQQQGERPALDLREHLKEFLHKYAGTLGTAAGIATVGLISLLLLQLGLRPEFVRELVSAIKFPE